MKAAKPKSFEDAMARLQALLVQMQDPETPLNKALQLYAESADLIAYCHSTLSEAKLKIEEIDASLMTAVTPTETDV